MRQSTEQKKSGNLLWQYAGMATQMLVTIGLALFIGMQADKYLHNTIPILIWVLPLVFILFMLIKAIRDTGRKK